MPKYTWALANCFISAVSPNHAQFRSVETLDPFLASLPYHGRTYRHIITPLSVVPIDSLAADILGYHTVQRIPHILARIIVPVLIQAERAAGVLDEEMEDADAVVFDLGDGGGDVRGDEVDAAGARGQGDGALGEGHFGIRQACAVGESGWRG